jgi:hypothetical protein
MRQALRVWLGHALTGEAADVIAQRLEDAGIPVVGYTPADGGRSTAFMLLPKVGAAEVKGVNIDADPEDVKKLLKTLAQAGVARVEFQK